MRINCEIESIFYNLVKPIENLIVLPYFRQSKKYISESQMIKHISQLHISDNEDSTPDSESSEEEDCHHETLPRLRYDLSQNTFKNKLSQQLNNVKKITIAEQFKSRLRMDDDLLFAKILKHANTEPFSSCRSLVVWKPPPVSLDNILPVHSSKAEDKNGRGTKLPPPPPAMEIDEM